MNITTQTLKEVITKFNNHARVNGYTEPVCGDYAFTKHRTPHSPMIRLVSAKNNKLQIAETGIGHYEID